MPDGKEDDISSTSVAVQNLMLAAYENGLGTSWTAGIVFYREKEISELMGVEDKKLLCVILIGYPAETLK